MLWALLLVGVLDAEPRKIPITVSCAQPIAATFFTALQTPKAITSAAGVFTLASVTITTDGDHCVWSFVGVIRAPLFTKDTTLTLAIPNQPATVTATITRVRNGRTAVRSHPLRVR